MYKLVFINHVRPQEYGGPVEVSREYMTYKEVKEALDFVILECLTMISECSNDVDFKYSDHNLEAYMKNDVEAFGSLYTKGTKILEAFIV